MTARLIREIHEEATRARTTPAPPLTFGLWRRFADTGDRLAYEQVYFERRRRLAALVLAAHLDERADPALDDLLWSVCDEYTWVLPAHAPAEGPRDDPRDDPAGDPVNDFVDLFSAETGHTLAEALSLLGDLIDPRVRDRVGATVDHRVLRPLSGDSPAMWWESSTHNWASVCGGAAGMAALALDSDRLPTLLPRAEAALAAFLSGIGPDGACLEGPDYWTYGFGYYVYFAEALRERTGRDLLTDPPPDLPSGPSPDRKVRELAAYPARIDFGGGHRPAFADSSAHGDYPPGLLDRLGERLGVPLPEQAAEPSFHDDPCYRFAHLSRTLWWTTGRPRTPATGPAFLPDAAIAVGRANGVCFAAKGGHNAEPHNHLDLGHFVLHVRGETPLTDLGAPEYTRDYFRDGRYDVLNASAEGHSVPLINGTAQLPGPSHRAHVLAHESSDAAVTLTLDLTEAYATPSLTLFHRAFDWRPDRLVLTDTFEFHENEAEVAELFISRHHPTLTPDTITWGPITLEVPEGWHPSAEELAITGHDGDPETVHRVHLTAHIPSGPHQFTFTVT
jgi:hypothetical protein